jgi:hypothetical protein
MEAGPASKTTNWDIFAKEADIIFAKFLKINPPPPKKSKIKNILTT